MATATTLYKWVDKNGVVHYSDRPVPGAVKVDIHESQTYSPPPQPNTQSATAPDKAAAKGDSNSYERLEIWQPQPDEVFNNTANTVPVRLRLDPALRPNHFIWLYLDGKRVDGLSDKGDSFELKEVWRGSHTLTAVITDNAGKTILSSQPVTFHVRQTNLLSPGSRLKPKPPGGK